MWGNEFVSPNKNNKISENTVSANLQLTANFYGSPRMLFISQFDMPFVSRIEPPIPETKDIFN